MLSLGLSLWSSTILGRGDPYAVLGIRPELAFDFETETYRTDSAPTSFSDAITHTRAGNATMVDSDGLLKWAPHNLLTYSEQFDNAAWAKFNSSVTPNAALAPDGTMTADLWVPASSGTQTLERLVGVSSNTDYTASIFLKAENITSVIVREDSEDGISELVDLTDGTSGGPSVKSENYGNGWWRFYYTTQVTGVNFTLEVRATGTPNGTDGIYVWGAHLYRSDLGGMAAIPADAQAVSGADTYVPTTSSEVYLPRRGHHIYNGSAWVNEGLLHESNAATNRLPYSKAEIAAGQWSDSPGGSLTTSSTASSLGLNAFRLTPSTGSNAHLLFDIHGGAGSTQYCAWALVEADGYDWAYLSLGNTGYPADADAWFDIASGSVGTVGANVDGYGIVEFADGIYLVWISATALSSGVKVFAIAPKSSDGTSNYAGDGTSGIIVHHAQVEEGSLPSSTIVANGAATTRDAETLTVPAANLPYDSTNMSIQMDGLETFADEGSATQETLFDWRVDANNRITLSLDTDSAKVGTLTLTMVNGSGTDETISTTAELTPGVNDPFNVAIVCTSTEIGIALDGYAETRVSHSIGIPDLSGADATLGGNGTRALVRAWSQDITNAGQEAATT